MTVRLARIDLFPIKSFDSVSVERARVLPAGCLEQDRRFALFDAEGRFVNGKRTPLVHALRLSFDAAFDCVTIADRAGGSKQSYSLATERQAIETFFSKHFGFPVTLRENAQAGFPDDTLASGPTIIAAETLAAVADWFGLPADDARERFRANLVVEGGSLFWDDRLFAAPGESVTFRIGELSFFGMNPCARCVVPSRDPHTAEQIPGFARSFSLRRRELLPAWAEPDAFDHFYRLAVNTRLFAPSVGGMIQIGDAVQVAGG